MALKLGEIFVEVKAKTGDLRKGLTKSRKLVGGLATSLKRLKGPLIALGVAGAATGGALILAFKKASDAANVQEQAITALAVSLRNAGDASQESLQDQLDFAASLQKVTTFGDEEIIGLQALIASFGATGEELKKATKLTLDLATAKKIDLKAAADLVGKAFVGEVGSLSRYGIIIDKNIPKSEKFAAVLDKINQQFGGAAEAQRQTFIGQVQALRGVFGDLLEPIGAVVNRGLEPLVENLTKTISKFLDTKKSVGDLQANVANIVAFFVVAGRSVVQFGSDTVTVFKFLKGPMSEFIQETGKVGNSLERILLPVAEISPAFRLAKIALAAFRTAAVDSDTSLAVVVRGLQEAGAGSTTFAEKIANARKELGLTGTQLDEVSEKLNILKAQEIEAADRKEEQDQKDKDKREEKKKEDLEDVERKKILTKVFAAQDTFLTTLFAKNLTKRQKQLRVFGQISKSVQASITKSAIANLGKRIAADQAGAVVEVGAAKPGIAAKLFSSFAKVPFGLGIPLAIAAIGLVFGFLGRLLTMQGGGVVPGVGTRDTVPALLTPGEVVLPTRIVDFFRGVGIPAVAPALAAGPPSVSVLVTGNVIDTEERAESLGEIIKDDIVDVLMRQTRVT